MGSAVIVCSVIPFGIHRWEYQLALERARDAGMPSFFHLQPLVVAAAAIMLIFLLAARGAKLRFTAGRIVLLAVGGAIVCGVAALFLGPPMGAGFLDGLGERARASGMETNVVSWAREVLGNPPSNPKKEEWISLSRNRVPPSLVNFFGDAGDDFKVNVTYSGKNRAEGTSMNAIAGGGFSHWGIVVFKNPANTSLDKDPHARRCGEGFYVYSY
jgi:hypothetical protein